MILTEEMQKIMNLIQDDENNVFVTGKAGSGKTTFLKYLIEKSGKNCIVAAPTGIAAINAGALHCIVYLAFLLDPLHLTTDWKTNFQNTR